MEPSEHDSAVHDLADQLFRRESAKIVSILTGIFGTNRLPLVEDAVQDALIRAMKTWPFYGAPENPTAWLVRAARNRALDQIRREANFHEKQPHIIAAVEARLAGTPGSVEAGNSIEDDHLRLMFVCCHPELPAEAQAALALKTLCGFSPAEIASGFLISEAAAAKRLTRARQRLRERNVPFEIPPDSELPARLNGVLKILYLLFSEGHKASHGETVVRAELCTEAIRLGELLARHPVGDRPVTHALLALMQLTAARLPARVDGDGALLRLEDQDRSRWDRVMIGRGVRHLAQSASGDQLTEYHLQAGIAACHTLAADEASTDWPRILEFYDRLMEIAASPVVALNRAVAVSRVHGSEAGILAVESITGRDQLSDYHFYHAILGELESKAGRNEAAAAHFERALESAGTAPEQAFIARRLDDCRRQSA